MPLLLREVALELDEDESVLPDKIASYLKVPIADIAGVRVVRRGIDARQKPRVRRMFSLSFTLPEEQSILARFSDDPRLAVHEPPKEAPFRPVSGGLRVLVVGMGPAGLFAALRLALQGADVILVERGEPVEKRVLSVRDFWESGVLDVHSNVQFGEGGAGTFSDGKLTTRVNSPWNRFVLQTFVDCGAPPGILLDAKPHLGTDVLRRVLVRFRKTLADSGAEIRFASRLTGVKVCGGRIVGGILNRDETVRCDALVLAPGHSARDTYEMLAGTGVAMEKKAFAVGFRVEHPVELINEIQYGFPSHPSLPAADYALKWTDGESGRGVYSFCMCPGGEVITASSEEGGMVVNGMSNLGRNRPWSNSALVVSVGPEDFGGNDVLAGMRFQRHWERKAFAAGGGGYIAPAQNLLAFLGVGSGPVRSTCRPGVRQADLTSLLPPVVIAALRRGLTQFELRMRGFVTAEATLVGIETRTSAPLRILRSDSGESISHPGLFPSGEGAGYAGGIMSAAIDGIVAAERIIDQYLQGVFREKSVC